MTKKRCESLSDQLREAILKDGRTQNAIAKATRNKVSRFRICHFLKGDGILLKNADALFKVLDLKIVPRNGEERAGQPARSAN